MLMSYISTGNSPNLVLFECSCEPRRMQDLARSELEPSWLKDFVELTIWLFNQIENLACPDGNFVPLEGPAERWTAPSRYGGA